MKTRINRNFIAQTNSDNAFLTSMTTVVHKFPEPGEYEGVIYFRGSPVRSFRIGVTKPSTAAAGSSSVSTKVEIDMRALYLARGTETEEARYALEAGGYAVFRVPAGTPGGYSVEIRQSSEGREGPKVFNSRELNVDDIFAVVMIRPGKYKIECTTGASHKSEAQLTVAYPDKSLAPLNPVKLDCGKDGIIIGQVDVHPMQGLVFSFGAPSQIRVELVTPDDRQRVTVPKPGPRATEKKRLTRRYSMFPTHS
jgi:hypothetical protein